VGTCREIVGAGAWQSRARAAADQPRPAVGAAAHHRAEQQVEHAGVTVQADARGILIPLLDALADRHVPERPGTPRVAASCSEPSAQRSPT
jgi:hypothetical protein